ncbi:MAG TPA: hypothetical protein VFS43_22210 [Polyangiaceae bacterium]|nr:hypothetical protein [Polyangiaceae bacterium]
MPLRRRRPPALVLGDLTLVRPHGMAGIPVVVGTTDPDDVTLRSRYVSGHVVLPGFEGAGLERSAVALLEVGARLADASGGRVPLVYGTDRHLELLYRYRRELARYYLFLLNDDELGWALHDKARFAALCEARGVLAPKTVEPGAEPARALAGLAGPVVVKPRCKASWAVLKAELFGGAGKARAFASPEELLAHPGFRKHAAALLVQERVDCDTAGLCSFHGFADAEGRLLASFCGRKVRTYPAFAGESSLIELTDDPAVDRAGRAAAGALGLKGPFKIDLARDRASGRYYTLEVNARYTLWNYLGAAHGVNLPAIAYAYLVEGRAPAAPPAYAPTYRWLNFYRDARAFREGGRRGWRAAAAWASSLSPRRLVYELFAWTDPAPFLHWAGRAAARKALRRAWA